MQDNPISLEEAINKFMEHYLTSNQKIWWLQMHLVVNPQIRLTRKEVCVKLNQSAARRAHKIKKRQKKWKGITAEEIDVIKV